MVTSSADSPAIWPGQTSSLRPARTGFRPVLIAIRDGVQDGSAWWERNFATSRVESLRVERLAKHLGVAKSGFYWHFKDRHALLRKLLRYWVKEYTG